MFIYGKDFKWSLKIGLEIHIHLKTKNKLFSECLTKFDEITNFQTSLIDMSLPGLLPIINKKCVNLSIKMGIVLNGRIKAFLFFDRKHYFYPDLPQGYQITQFYHPIVLNGFINILKKKILISKIHIEQDSAKILHKNNSEFIDFNRCGIPLIEIVTYPNFCNSEEVQTFLKKLRMMLKYINISNSNLEQGAIRCDINISIKYNNNDNLYGRVEIKNLNSFNIINKSIISESTRQIIIYEAKKKIKQETRYYNKYINQTFSMRKKEIKQDYRYLPDPDILIMNISKNYINNISCNIEELFFNKKIKYLYLLDINIYDINFLTNNKSTFIFFEYIISNICTKLAINWICIDLSSRIKKYNINYLDILIFKIKFINLVQLINLNNISIKITKIILDKIFILRKEPIFIINQYNFNKILYTYIINKYIKNII